jgi:DNA transformation protein
MLNKGLITAFFTKLSTLDTLRALIKTGKNSMKLVITDIIERLSPFGDISSRPMFGGFGIYKDGIIIAIVADEELYFKSIAKTQDFYKSFGSTPFVYEGQKRPIQMSYWIVPETVLNDPETLEKWVDTAFDSSKEYQAKHPPKRTKRIV